MASQALMEFIKAGYEYTYGFPGFGGNNIDGGVDQKETISGVDGGSFVKRPMFHALRLFGEATKHSPKLLAASGEGAITLALKWWIDGKLRVRVFLLNKLNSAQDATIAFSNGAVPTTFNVWRYSSTETQAGTPAANPISGVTSSQFTATLAARSLTVVELYQP